jgi:hypothetical protein
MELKASRQLHDFTVIDLRPPARPARPIRDVIPELEAEHRDGYWYRGQTMRHECQYRGTVPRMENTAPGINPIHVLLDAVVPSAFRAYTRPKPAQWPQFRLAPPLDYITGHCRAIFASRDRPLGELLLSAIDFLLIDARRRKPVAQWTRHLEHMASRFSCGCCWGRATRLPACGSGESRGRFLCFHRTTKSQLQTPSWAAPQKAVETVVYKFRTNSRSHELWRETAQERPDRPQGRKRKSGAWGKSAAVTGHLRVRPKPERQFALCLMAEDWKPGSNVLRFLTCHP